jgi:alpha-beta hydrolase superfamily lysophospholipase
MTRDPARQKAYDSDPLIFRKANARWFTESEDAQNEVMARAKEITLPFHLTIGTSDPVVAGGRDLYEAVASADKKLDAREGLLHEVLNEPEGPEIANAMADWVLARA